ncbi:MAG TPA: hypothetical protein DIT04_00820, partial [Dysgonomonas sp.]|nr:hypothetical protein [Dysgonomonas sp.]
YCAGSLFPETIAKGGYADNHLKTIMTRSGHTIALNDEESSLSITIKDRNGNIMNFDTVGKNITITAPETITMNANNIILNAETSITSSAGEDITSSAGNNVSTSAGNNMMDVVRNDYNMMAANITELAKENHQSDADNIKQVAVKDVTIQSTGGKILKNAKTRIDNNSGEKSTFQ